MRETAAKARPTQPSSVAEITSSKVMLHSKPPNTSTLILERLLSHIVMICRPKALEVLEILTKNPRPSYSHPNRRQPLLQQPLPRPDCPVRPRPPARQQDHPIYVPSLPMSLLKILSLDILLLPFTHTQYTTRDLRPHS